MVTIVNFGAFLGGQLKSTIVLKELKLMGKLAFMT